MCKNRLTTVPYMISTEEQQEKLSDTRMTNFWAVFSRLSMTPFERNSQESKRARVIALGAASTEEGHKSLTSFSSWPTKTVAFGFE